MFGWSTISFATVSSVQSSSYTLRWRLKSLFGSDEDSLLKLLARVHKFFTAVQVGPEPDENAVSYPDDASTDPKGMAVEFRYALAFQALKSLTECRIGSNVTFNYSGSKAKQPAINDISFSILPGQLIVIVGANGSGKTSMVKLLTRVHEPNTGTIIIDGHSAEHFKHFDLREATAVLSQDHTLFGGVSIAEDVGLGRWKAQQRRELIEQALHLGGATHLLSKLNAGSDTVLSPVQTKELGYQITNGPLKRMHDKIEKESSVSGGEKQRLVAYVYIFVGLCPIADKPARARTFMRMNTGNVKLVVVDEPSAAMDPAGEFELFKHLREARQGKTMIFITHRFGHLTKHADAIFCMKDGELVERGTHAELVARKGEYYNLYNIQAQAFAAEVSNSGGNEVGEAATAPRLDISS
jgi:ABC-type multidrug transport system fused ATPase/permease subunit